MAGLILAIDQGTTSSRALLFDGPSKVAAVAQKEFPQIYPKSGWVEHDPEEIWKTVATTARTAMAAASAAPKDIAAIGITNQRETVVVWDRTTGHPIHNAIVWQDRRTATFCDRLRKDDLERTFTEKTGLLLDPYFSATKLSWLLDHVPNARRRAADGQLLFGTIDTWLIWRLTGGRVHATDATNASRTLLYDIRRNAWDPELLRILDIPEAMLPAVRDCADDFGETQAEIFGAPIAIRGVAGDQQAATVGQACFEPGTLKSTYGTGCFAVLNTGTEMVPSKNRLLSTIAYRLKGRTTYALEGSIFIAGAAVQWLRDGLEIIEQASQADGLAEVADPHQNVYLVPAFVGLGAPWWDAEARGAIFGLVRNTGPAELARAALESVAYQTRDLFDAMRKDWQATDRDTILRVDGGMVASDWTMQCLADILDVPVDRPAILETTALGAAWLAGVGSGVWPDKEGFAQAWALERRFLPQMGEATRHRKLEGWRDAVRRTLSKN